MKELAPGLLQFGSAPPDGQCGAIYLVGEGSERVLIDAGTASNYSLLQRELATEGLRPHDIGAVYLTHGHSDHYEGAVALRRESDAVIYVGEPDRMAVETGDYWGTAGFYYGRHSLPLPDTQPISTGYEHRLGSMTLRAIETPGHTPGSITYELIIPRIDARIALMGDTAWGGWHERIGSNLDVWKESVETLIARQYTSLSFGHGVIKLVTATAHLDQLYSQIGKYNNAYDLIPPHHFIKARAMHATVIKDNVD